MVAYLRHVVQPLEAQRFDVVVCGDLRTAAGAEEDVAARFRTVFGRRVQYVRVQAELLGGRQLASITSAWDIMRHQLRIRTQTESIVGVYIVRADVELKQPGMAEWAKDRYGFLWYTKSERHGRGVNDILFYVPKKEFCYFRQSLMQTRERWKQASLHWLLQDERVKEAMSIEFNFNHPSDTLLCGNPIYRITSREEGYVDTGKFHEHHLERSRDASAVRCDMDQMDDASRLEAFTVYCHAVMRTWFSECAVDGKNKEGMPLSEWKTWWYRVWPDYLLADYLPVRGTLMRSLQHTRGFVADSAHVRWIFGHPQSKRMAHPKRSK